MNFQIKIQIPVLNAILLVYLALSIIMIIAKIVCLIEEITNKLLLIHVNVNKIYLMMKIIDA